MLAWTGGARSLMDFLRGFVAIGDGTQDTWPDARLEPLAEYILSLRAPANPQVAAVDRVNRGRHVFRAAGCTTCHGGPRGSGKTLYTTI